MQEAFKKGRKPREWMVRGHVSGLNISNKGRPLRGKEVREKKGCDREVLGVSTAAERRGFRSNHCQCYYVFTSRMTQLISWKSGTLAGQRYG